MTIQDQKLILTISTLEKEMFSGAVEQVSIPTVSGEITVLPHHIPLVSSLANGVLRAKAGEEEIRMAVFGGVVEVSENMITVLADTAEMADKFSEKDVSERKARLEKLIERHPKESREYEALSKRLDAEVAKLKMLEKK